MEHDKDRMREGNTGQELVKGIEDLDAIELADQQQVGAYLGEPDAHQKKILVELSRIHHSLRGPEHLLDKGNYSRPIPPRSPVIHKRGK